MKARDFVAMLGYALRMLENCIYVECSRKAAVRAAAMIGALIEASSRREDVGPEVCEDLASIEEALMLDSKLSRSRHVIVALIDELCIPSSRIDVEMERTLAETGVVEVSLNDVLQEA